jgi:hypothetical protein
MTRETTDAEKGRKFQAEVRRFIEEVVGENPDVNILSEAQVQGLSASWRLDILVVGRSVLTDEFSMYLAIINCKHVKEGAKPATYWTEMSRAYMELNDVKLNSELGDPKFFMVVNRHCVKGETDKNYPALFKNIGVELINFNSGAELDDFRKQLHQLLRENTPLEQIKKIEDALKAHHKT